jgi:DNA-binding NtrC family response regulator
MSKEEIICRILIVDNDLNYARQVAFELEQIRPDLLLNEKLRIEITNSAYFVGDHLENWTDDILPWDIILSDVYMPIPSTPLNRKVAQTDAKLKKIENSNWNLWEYEYTWNSCMEGEPSHGGVYIAQKVKELRKIRPNIKNLKVVLISDKLFSPSANEMIYDYLKSERSWFNYYDKAHWEEYTDDWPAHLHKPKVFRWAIIHAINERNSILWGDSISNDNEALNVVSKTMKETIVECKRLIKNNNIDKVLITGEKGTGKSLTARMLHKIQSEALKARGKFVTVECTSHSDELFQGQLFGHTKGAYTDATTDEDGFIEAAKDGTLFFDEIGDLSPVNQGKLLRLLQDGKFVKLGTNEDRKMEAKLVIFATNKNLKDLIKENLFRADLYDRLNPPPIQIPPLRERRDEIVPLAEYFLGIYNSHIKLSDDAKEFLKNQNWEGNVRQLQNTIKIASSDCTTRELKVSDIQNTFTVAGNNVKTDHPKPSPHYIEQLTPEGILDGKIKWVHIKKAPYSERAAIMVAVKGMWRGDQCQLAKLLDVKQNSLEQFFSTLRKKYKCNEIGIEDMKPHISRDFHPSLEKFFA